MKIWNVIYFSQIWERVLSLAYEHKTRWMKSGEETESKYTISHLQVEFCIMTTIKWFLATGMVKMYLVISQYVHNTYLCNFRMRFPMELDNDNDIWIICKQPSPYLGSQSPRRMHICSYKALKALKPPHCYISLKIRPSKHMSLKIK